MVGDHVNPSQFCSDPLPRARPPGASAERVGSPVLRERRINLSIEEQARAVSGVKRRMQQRVNFDRSLRRVDFQTRQEDDRLAALGQQLRCGVEKLQRCQLFCAHEDWPRGGCEVKRMPVLTSRCSPGFSSTNLPFSIRSRRYPASTRKRSINCSVVYLPFGKMNGSSP